MHIDFGEAQASTKSDFGIPGSCVFFYAALIRVHYKRSNQEVCSRLILYRDACLIRCTIVIVAMGTYIIVGDVGKFFHRQVKIFFCPELVQVCTLVL